MIDLPLTIDADHLMVAFYLVASVKVLKYSSKCLVNLHRLLTSLSRLWLQRGDHQGRSGASQKKSLLLFSPAQGPINITACVPYGSQDT